MLALHDGSTLGLFQAKAILLEANGSTFTSIDPSLSAPLLPNNSISAMLSRQITRYARREWEGRVKVTLEYQNSRIGSRGHFPRGAFWGAEHGARDGIVVARRVGGAAQETGAAEGEQY